jgi:hypothetical protein
MKNYDKDISEMLTVDFWYDESKYDWRDLMGVVEFIEELDRSDRHYRYMDNEGEERSNFLGYTVEIEGGSCCIWLRLELDPYKLLVESHDVSKMRAVYRAIGEFAILYKQDTV